MEEEELLCVSWEAGGAVFGGWREVYVLLRGLVGGQGEQRSVQEGFCPAVGLRGVTAHRTFEDHGTVQSDAWRCVCTEHGRRALPHRVGAACPGGAGGRGVTLFSHSGVQLHLSMAPLARAPLPLLSSVAPPDFPRCPFPLC